MLTHSRPRLVERVPGDPGIKRLLLGWNAVSSNFTVIDNERDRLRAVNIPLGFGTTPTLEQGIYRIFCQGATDWYDTSWGTRSSPGEIRKAMAKGLVVHACMGNWNPVPGETFFNDMAAGLHDTELDQLVTNLKEVEEDYKGVLWMGPLNEPDQGGKDWLKWPSRVAAMRAAARYMKFYLLAHGVRNYAQCTPTLFNQTAYLGATYLTNSLSGTVGVDPMAGTWAWNPDWKGTFTSWANHYTPNPVDFIQPGETGPDGFVGPALDIMAQNSYCYHAKGGSTGHNLVGNIWAWTSAPSGAFTSTVYEAHSVSSRNFASYAANGGSPNGLQHSDNYFRFRDNLYGRYGMPMVYGEWGYNVWEQQPITTPGSEDAQVFPNDTVALWNGFFVDEFADYNVIGVDLWRQELDSDRFPGITDEFGFGNRGADYPINGTSATDWSYTDDPAYDGTRTDNMLGTDARRKAFASMWHRTDVVSKNRLGL